MYDLLAFRDLSGLDWQQFFAVYRESSSENAELWYPELSEEEALKKYEEGYRNYLTGEFQTSHGTLIVLAKDGFYCSALRLLPQEQDHFLLEALETHPTFREMGFGKRILQETMLFLHANNPGCFVCSHVSRKNQISILTHRAAGFSASKDLEGDFLMTWSDAQLARIEEQEARLDRVLASKTPSMDDLRALETYYEGPLWRLDFESDEAGQIPDRVKRGVLSEDAIYDILNEYQEMLR